jgi:hypothetical protein
MWAAQQTRHHSLSSSSSSMAVNNCWRACSNVLVMLQELFSAVESSGVAAESWWCTSSAPHGNLADMRCCGTPVRACRWGHSTRQAVLQQLLHQAV